MFRLRNTRNSSGHIPTAARSFRWVSAWVVAVVPMLAMVWVYMPTPVAAITTSSTRSPTTCTNVAGIGNVAWTTAANATASDNNYADVAMGRNDASNYLRCTGFGFTVPAGVVISGITARVERLSSNNNSNPGDVEHRLMKAGATVGTSQTASAPWSTTETVALFGGATNLWGTTWSVTDVNNSGFGFSIAVNASKNNTLAEVDHVSIEVSYSFNPTFTQTNYQWYTNANSLTVTSPLNGVSQNTATSAPAAKGTFRLRQLIRVTTDVAPTGGFYTFKLQYADKGVGTCAAASYADVTTSTPIAYADNATPTDGQTTVAAASPTDAGATGIIPQEYNELNNTGIIANIQSGYDGLWDFALQDFADTFGKTYCLRMVHATGTPLNTYLQYPTISTSPGTKSIGFVDNAGSPVATPTFSMPNVPYLSTCQTSTTTLGTAGGTKLRLTQTGNAGNGWNISIAPTSGSTALWYASDSGGYYDFDDPSGSPPGCNSGADGDSYAGQLSLDKSTSAVNAQGGCTTTGLSTGSGTSGFTTGNPAITLLTATSAAQSNCWWDLYGTGFSQTIPPSQPPGAYGLSLTLTVTSS